MKVGKEKLKNKNQKYNKVFGFVNWENTGDKLAHKSCKGTFFKDSYLNLKPLLPSTPRKSETLSTTDVPSTDQSSGLLKNSRQSLQDKSKRASWEKIYM